MQYEIVSYEKSLILRKWRADDPRRLRMAEKRAEILRAARPILLRDGLGGTTLDRVAAEGGINKMTLYRHFPSKEALFEGLVIGHVRIHARGT